MSLLSYYPRLKHFNTSKESVFSRKMMSLAEAWIDQSRNLDKKRAIGKDSNKGSVTNKGWVFYKKGRYEPSANYGHA